MLDGGASIWTVRRSFEIPALAPGCGNDAALIRALAAEPGKGEPAIVCGRIGASTAAFGSLSRWLIMLLNIAAGNLDRIGGAVFSSPAAEISDAMMPGVVSLLWGFAPVSSCWQRRNAPACRTTI